MPDNTAREKNVVRTEIVLESVNMEIHLTGEMLSANNGRQSEQAPVVIDGLLPEHSIQMSGAEQPEQSL